LKKYSVLVLLTIVPCACGAQSALAASKETIQMMQQLDTLTQMVQSLQRAVDTQGAVLKTLVEQANDNVNAMKGTIADLQKTNQQTLGSLSNRFDAMTSQVQELSASLDETKARLAKLSDQLAQTQKAMETLGPSATGGSTPGGGAPGGNATPAAGEAAAPQPPPDPESLYNSALGYYHAGQYDLAVQAFQQYLQNYADGEYASNAQFYIGECYYSQKNYAQAIEEYNTCIERYPKGNKLAAAQLKKGYALLALDKTQAGERELRSLVRRFPKSPEANLARQRLKQIESE
jgi:tol-pal system protein YbgF